MDAIIKSFLKDLNIFCYGSLWFQRNIKDFEVVFLRAVKDVVIFE